MKALAISVVVLGALLFGAVVANAGWGWNAKIDVGGTVISTQWEVDAKGGYNAQITVTVPKKAKISLVDIASDVETVELRHSKKLRCTESGIEASVKYEFEANKGRGGRQAVVVTVALVDNGVVLGEASGSVRDTLKVDVVIPGACEGSQKAEKGSRKAKR